MSDKHPIRNTVIGGLILAGILAVVSNISLIFTAAKAGLAFVFGVLGTPLALPVWLLGFGFSVLVISTRRHRLAKKAEEKRISTTELICDEPIEYEGEWGEEEEEVEDDWRSYTSDNILHIDWQWRWHGQSIESLTPICPNCKLELLENTRPFSNAGYDNRLYLKGISCQDEACDFKHYPLADTVHEYHEIIKKHIRRNAREKGLPI